MIRRCVSVLATAVFAVVAGVGGMYADAASPQPTTAPAAALGAPVTAGPTTVTLADAYYSTAGSQLVVVLEVTSSVPVSPSGYSAVYIGPDGQQVEALGAIEPDDIFPGATAVSVLVFPAATPGGTVRWSSYDESYTEFDVAITVPA